MSNSVNLLPCGFRRRQSARRIVSQWAMLCGLVISTMMMVWLQQSDHQNPDEILELQAQASPLHALATHTASLRLEITELESRWNVLRNLLPTDDVLQTIGCIGLACKNTNGRVHIDSLELNIDRPSRLETKPESAESLRSTQSPSPDLVLRLSADDDTVAAGLVDHLKTHPRFQSVRLHSAAGSHNGAKRAVELRCQIVARGGSR